MGNNHKQKYTEIIDDDLYEEFDDETLYKIMQEARKEALQREAEANQTKRKRPFLKWAFCLIVVMLLFNVVSLLPQTFSIPAIDFLITSAKLSAKENIQELKKAVVVIETDDSRGTGFSISSDGTILTNYHVIEDEKEVTVAFPDEGLFNAEVVGTYPSIDLAVLQIDQINGLPSLTLAPNPTFQQDDHIYFIGNPLRFQGIANEGTIIDSIQLSDWKEEVYMIQAPVYRGNSGSPVINENGLVIGVVFATLDHESYGKVGLFIPIDSYLQVTDF